jgi:vancomycin permeability regulator SanA
VRRSALVGVIMAASLALYFCVTLAQVWMTGRSDSFAGGARTVDAVVVLGAAQYDGRPSPQLRARLDHALRLWQRGATRLIVTTGGKQVGDRFTEAESGRRYLMNSGVPDDAIVVEPQGESTFESLDAVQRQSSDMNLGRVAIVSDPYHVLRATLVARELGFDARASATRSSVTRGGDAFARNVRESLGIMVGRLVGFRRLESWLQ